MDFALTLLLVFAAWQFLRVQYQRSHIALLGRHLANLQLEKHMETLTQGYARAIREESEPRQLQILETFAPSERSLASQARALANSLRDENPQATRMTALSFCVPYAERFLPNGMLRDFRVLIAIHANGLRHVVDNAEGLDPKARAFHLSAELYLLQHSCHWFCKSRAVADARLLLRHQVNHRKVLESVSEVTRRPYLEWLQGRAPRADDE
ncbi:hypothetical protein CEK29_05075 [Bordetella genomosp. 5]|uniref:DUF4760 domain-containing protein n=1 Tax=Bordetella genomosp. 5 TaxID=1395608 RepID=A0A261TAE5_9BORD|nr:hypothetical protein [Bordetella genomosp. 5]OZI45613.1 hypothetical protein CAL25_20420 [Bordetella genomosp. 5]OZI46252.1 hypothetical protein CEK29_05075 [Bordetella genomosp. 5]